jgi:hypothetical protein
MAFSVGPSRSNFSVMVIARIGVSETAVPSWAFGRWSDAALAYGGWRHLWLGRWAGGPVGKCGLLLVGQ